MNVKTLWNGTVIIFEFDTQYELTSSFIRFQEHYESPEYAGKIFTLGEYRKWYTDTYGSFSYYQDWNGFNIPDNYFNAFVEGLFDPLTEQEKVIVDVIRHVKTPFYVIGVHSKDSAIDHELTHAAFKLFKDYRDKAIKLMSGYKLDEMKKHLLSIGYSEKVFLDECNAYLVNEASYLKKNKVKYPKKLQKDLISLYKGLKNNG